ncbi:hypothetical protein HX001_06745 [Empedobacter brevis]|uniref:Uncharacterized protein n=1 Tax=Empedobacter brevis TaxID=247 RepID=A0AAJ1QE14_9FLAO|nr:hypothetical protein [Empedobacter brevis]MDM1072192.1 hypothetical protein [Empedobacter brevis]QHC83909.1 hypothetical protein AS589_03425 [Empedobacter brevis]
MPKILILYVYPVDLASEAVSFIIPWLPVGATTPLLIAFLTFICIEESKELKALLTTHPETFLPPPKIEAALVSNLPFLKLVSILLPFLLFLQEKH